MFNSSNNEKDDNPISDVFHNLTTNQKMSVMNLLLTIASCDGDQDNQDKELQFLSTYARLLNVLSDNSMAYLENYGHERIFQDLQSLSDNQKEFLVVAAWEMIICDGKPNERELQVTGKIFKNIGVSEEHFISTIQKSHALMNYFSGK